MDQKKKMKTKKRKGLQFKNLLKFWFLSIFHEFRGEDLIKRSSVQKFSQILVIPKIAPFSIKSEVKTKKKGLLFKNFENSEAISTILRVSGLNLNFGSPEPINFFGAQSSRGWAELSFGGARPRNAPLWRRAWIRDFYADIVLRPESTQTVEKRMVRLRDINRNNRALIEQAQKLMTSKPVKERWTRKNRVALNF